MIRYVNLIWIAEISANQQNMVSSFFNVYLIPFPEKYKYNPIAILNIIINSTDDSISIPKVPKKSLAKADKTAVESNVYKNIFTYFPLFG